MYLSFRFDADTPWAMDLRKVHRIEPNQGIFGLPKQKASVLGLLHFGDLLVPVFDFRQLLGSFLGAATGLPHLVLFYGKESLNAFPARVDESIQEDCVMVENALNAPFLDPCDLIYNDIRYHQLNFRAIEEHLNIP
ncbi:MAG TPA: chemotaxis protein CheW [Acidobacteriota bacterium]|nr:chemotaxis protein CheW [Acidobacteriota bacterium]